MIGNITNIKDIGVGVNDIRPEFLLSSPNDVEDIVKDVNVDDYIGVTNQNNISEVHIYKRSRFSAIDIHCPEWKEGSLDVSWFKEDEDIYLISNAEQLYGLKYLIEKEGRTFSEKTIKMSGNIDISDNEWEPIGKMSDLKRISSEYSVDFYMTPEADESKTFCGTFDGQGYMISGLNIKENRNFFFSLFSTAKNACFKNLILSDVNINGLKNESYCSSLVGFADGCQFINITVTGTIIGENCAGIVSVAQDSTFIDCNNYADLFLKSNLTNQLTCGGIVNQIDITENTIWKLNKKEPILFGHCSQNGKIMLDCKDVKGIYLGQLYANCPLKNPKMTFGFIIDRCEINPKQSTSISHMDEPSSVSGVFYGKKDGLEDPVNFVTNVRDKNDLLSGLIGKTDRKVSISTNKLIVPRKIKAMTIPGTVNTLRSESNKAGFITTDVNPLSKSDEICNLDPYFKYVKTIKS